MNDISREILEQLATHLEYIGWDVLPKTTELDDMKEAFDEAIQEEYDVSWASLKRDILEFSEKISVSVKELGR